MWWRIVLAGGLLALVTLGGAAAGQFEDGEAAFQHRDDATAVRLWRPLADKGDAEAQTSLGFMYQEGWGVPQDYEQALTWFRKAANQGDASAQFNIGLLYADGQGVPQDYELAHMWFNLSAAHAKNANTRAVAVNNRDLVAAKMTPAQIAEAQRMATEWAPK
jgi:uncharacterized protein